MPEEGFYIRARVGRPSGSSNSSNNGEPEVSGSIDAKYILRFACNVLLKAALLLLFHVLGWVKLAPLAESLGGWGVVATAAVLAVAFSLFVVLVYVAYVFAFAVTCGLGFVLLPFLGYFTMKGLVELTPQYVTLPNDDWWVLLLLGTAIWLVTVPMKRKVRPAQPANVIDGESRPTDPPQSPFGHYKRDGQQ